MVFLSYAAKDREFARRIASKLSALGLTVWDAAEKVAPGDNWLLEMGKGLQQSDAVVVLLSPASMASESVQREIEYALSTAKFENRLIPVQVKPTRELPWMKNIKVIKATSNLQSTGKQIVEALASSTAGAH